jgi:tRNA-dihydrouridine synthase
MSFWQQLPKPFFVLAPMDDVTDVVFRQVVTQAAPPNVLMTEFVATDGLQSAGRERTLERLRVEPNLEVPLVAQIWGKNPENYLRSAQDVAKMGFSGIDINMGCPEKGIVARGCCGGLIGQNILVSEIIQATREGAPELAISVKTRTGLTKTITEEWAGFLLTQDLDALTMHGRTVKEMSKVPAHWDEIAKVVRLRDEMKLQTVIIGNGDVHNRSHGLELASESGVDGIMIGRGVFIDLFAFSETPRDHTPVEMLQVLLSHVELYEEWGSNKPFQILKKFFKIYVNGWDGVAELRGRLMDATTPDEVRAIVAEVLPNLPKAKLSL